NVDEIVDEAFAVVEVEAVQRAFGVLAGEQDLQFVAGDRSVQREDEGGEPAVCFLPDFGDREMMALIGLADDLVMTQVCVVADNNFCYSVVQVFARAIEGHVGLDDARAAAAADDE